MKDYWNRPVIVLTAPRSGSSMVSGILYNHGVWVGKCCKADKWNPKGYFENIEINRILVREFGPCVHRCIRADHKPIKEQVINEITKQGYDGSTPWLYKCSALYADAFLEFDPIWVSIRRDQDSVYRSGLKSGKNSNLDSLKLHEEVLNEYEKEDGAARIYTPDIISGDYSAIEKLVTRIGLAYKQDILENFIEPEYWTYKCE